MRVFSQKFLPGSKTTVERLKSKKNNRVFISIKAALSLSMTKYFSLDRNRHKQVSLHLVDRNSAYDNLGRAIFRRCDIYRYGFNAPTTCLFEQQIAGAMINVGKSRVGPRILLSANNRPA